MSTTATTTAKDRVPLHRELVNTVDGIVWEAEVGKGAYTFVSPQVERLLGYPRERWLREAGFWKSILHPEDRARLTGDAYRKPGEKTDRHEEYRLITASGETIWMRDHIKVICAEDGKPVKMRGLLVDITERKRNEEQVRLLQMAELRASRIKSEFLANMSHEIRTPLNAIIGMTALSLGLEMSAELRDCLDTIKTAADSLLLLINDVLDYSKMDVGKLELENSDFDLPALCRNAVELVSPLAGEKHVAIETAFAGDLSYHLTGDPGRVLQILLNLLSNAVKFSPEGAQVSLRVDNRREGADIFVTRFVVEDHGIGIARELQQRLFQPFSQIDASTARKHGGTGLGLSICKHLVGLMNGSIGVESEAGRGATFWVEIPLRRGAEARPPSLGAEPALPALPERIRVLVAEDNPANQKVIRRFLQRLDVPADIVANGNEAVTAYRSQPYDVVIMDCQMPEMDGYTATQRIRQLERSQGRQPMPVIALTAHAFAEDRRRCEEAGMTGYLSKPITLKQLGETLAGAIRKEPSPSVVAHQAKIDAEYLRELADATADSSEGDLLEEIVATFKRSVPESLELIEKAMAAEDLPVLERKAHFLKSTCNSSGAVLMAALCNLIETSARKGELPSSVSASVAQLHEEFAPTLRELEALMEKRRQ